MTLTDLYTAVHRAAVRLRDDASQSSHEAMSEASHASDQVLPTVAHSVS